MPSATYAVLTPSVVPSLEYRTNAPEQLDDLTVAGRDLTAALRELRPINRFLGSYRVLRLSLLPLLERRRGRRLTILDLGAGSADHAEQVVRLGGRLGVEVHVTAIDANPAVVRFARTALDRNLPPLLRTRVDVVEGDAFQLDFEDGSFDVVTASHFLHHFADAECVRLLHTMKRLASHGIVINDLHRHVLAYAGIRAIASMLDMSAMVRHDGPLSVRRAFRPREFHNLAKAAGLTSFTVRRHWAFRLSLSTIQP